MKLISLLYALYVALDNSFGFTDGSLFSTYSSEADASVWLCASFHFSRNGPTETPAEIITQWEIKPVFAALPSSHVANHHFHSLTGVHFLTRRHSGKIRKLNQKWNGRKSWQTASLKFYLWCLCLYGQHWLVWSSSKTGCSSIDMFLVPEDTSWALCRSFGV